MILSIFNSHGDRAIWCNIEHGLVLSRYQAVTDCARRQVALIIKNGQVVYQVN